MAGVWKKTLNYLGLVEDDEDYVDELPRPTRRRFATCAHSPCATSRRRPRAWSARSPHRGRGHRRDVGDPQVRAATLQRGARRRRPLQERDAVIMNLQSTEDAIARRLVDFASGLVYGLDGKIELVANRVYLLTPANVEVSAEEREKFADGCSTTSSDPAAPGGRQPGDC